MPYPLQWGAPTFDAGNAFAIMSAAFASLVEVSLLLVNFGYLYAPVKLDYVLLALMLNLKM